MRLLDRLVNRYWEGEASGAAVLMPLASVDGNREASNQTLVWQIRDAYVTNGVVFACILARLMLLSEASFRFRDKLDKSLRVLPPRAGVLEKPWPNGTSGDLWARMIQDVDLTGNWYGWLAAPDRIVWMPAAEVVIVSQEVTAPGGGRYRDVIGYAWDPSATLPGLQQKQPAQFFTVDEVAHWAPYPDPTARFRGMSWMTPILQEVQADSGFTRYKTKYIDHGTPLTAVRYSQKLRPDTIEFIRKGIQQKLGGVANAWRPFIFDQGADPVIGEGLKGLDLKSIQAIGEERICAAAGVPPEIVGLRDTSPEAYKPAMERFAELHIRPLWRSGCAALETVISVPDGEQLWFDTSDIAALQEAETERAQVAQVHAAAILTLVQAGFTRPSIKAAIVANDMSLLVPDPNAPTPGVNERETINVADTGAPDTGPGSGTNSNTAGVLGKAGVPPGGGQTLTKPQTQASKLPMPSSIPTSPSSNGHAPRPSPNRG